MNQDEFIGPVNLGNPIERTVKDLSTMILKLSRSKSNIIYKDLHQDDPTKRKPDISLAKEKLGWSPSIKVEEGLLKTIEYFRS